MIGSIQNRDNFLGKIAKRLGRDQYNTVIEPPQWNYNPQDLVLQGASQDELVEVLKKQCKQIHTEFHYTTSENLSKTVSYVIEEYGRGPIVTWKDDRFTGYGLSPLLNESLPKEGVEVWEWDFTKKEENIRMAELANIGITISDITLAESGTVVLFSSRDKGRTVSFLPLKSIIIVPKSTLVPRMTQAARIIRERVNNGEHLASCINFITGPSNSADIEMNLVVGVHGPIEATYILVDDL